MTRSRPPAPNSAACLRGVVPLNRSGLAGRVFFPGKQVEELIGGQGIDLYSADGCGRGAHLEPNRKFVLECAGTPPPAGVAGRAPPASFGYRRSMTTDPARASRGEATYGDRVFAVQLFAVSLAWWALASLVNTPTLEISSSPRSTSV